MKKISSTLLCLLFITQASAYDFISDGIYYNILSEQDKTCEVTNETGSLSAESYSGSTTIPSSANNYSVTRIGNYAFSNCSSLTCISIPNSVTSIGAWAFIGCLSLTSISIPESTYIEPYAFSHCTSLPVIDSIRYAGTYLVEAVDKSLSSYNIKEGTRFIGRYAFSGCTNLTSISISNSVTRIENFAFENCSKLTTVILPYSLKYYGNAFSNCPSLTDIYDFSEDHVLASSSIIDTTSFKIHVPQGSTDQYLKVAVKEQIIEMTNKEIWYWTSSDNPIEFSSNEAFGQKIEKYNFSQHVGSLLFNDELTMIGRNAFSSKEQLVSIYLPNSVSTIGDYAFKNCTELQSIKMSSNATSIGNDAFFNCSKLAELELPASISSFGQRAFNGCTGLKSLSVYWNSPLQINENIFGNCDLSQVSLYVPYGSAHLYQAAPAWQNFGTIIERTPILNSLIDLRPDVIYASHEQLRKLQPYRTDTFALADEYEAAPLSPLIETYMQMKDTTDDKTFYLDGGKTYYLDGGYDITTKGFTLATRPEDVAKGLRAKVICGIGKNSNVYTSSTNGGQWQGPYAMFMFGRQPYVGEDENSEIYMKKLAFCNIDFHNPKALNYRDNAAGAGTVAGNYFFNMHSNGMAVTLDSLVIENCTFRRLVRGFIREQGANYRIFNHVLIKNNQFFDCGFYNQSAGGYPWITGSGNNAASNLYKDFKCVENTFYDSPFPSFFNESYYFDRIAGAWNITFSNNTLINFNTRANGAIFKMRNLPNGSVYNVENNLFVLTKQEGDQRVLQMWGADIRETERLEDGSDGKVTLNFGNNWSTNNDLTNGSIFSANPWTATSNNFGKLVKEETATLNGTLEVQVASVSATELFTSPCPPHMAKTSVDQNMHRADALDGTATSIYNVNLYYKNKTNEIYLNNVGDPRWREQPVIECIESISNLPDSKSLFFDLQGRRLSAPSHGILLYNGKKIIISNQH